MLFSLVIFASLHVLHGFQRPCYSRPLVKIHGSVLSDAPFRPACESYLWRGHRIRYLERRSGATNAPTIVLIHGFGASLTQYRAQVSAFAAAGLNVFALDLLGFGASDKPVGAGVEYSIELWTDLVTDFLAEVSGSRMLRGRLLSLSLIACFKNRRNSTAADPRLSVPGVQSFLSSLETIVPPPKVSPTAPGLKGRGGGVGGEAHAGRQLDRRARSPQRRDQSRGRIPNRVRVRVEGRVRVRVRAEVASPTVPHPIVAPSPQ